MNSATLGTWLERERQRAAAVHLLDEELGTHHGLSWDDFVLLETVHAAAGGLPLPRLAARLGQRASRVLLRTRPLEKLGLLARGTGAGQPLVLGSGGRRVLAEARETAAATCERLAAGAPAA